MARRAKAWRREIGSRYPKSEILKAAVEWRRRRMADAAAGPPDHETHLMLLMPDAELADWISQARLTDENVLRYMGRDPVAPVEAMP